MGIELRDLSIRSPMCCHLSYHYCPWFLSFENQVWWTKISLFFQIRWLRVEQRISDLDREIKASVHYQKPDMETCLKQLEELQTLAVTPFMFKKQPAIVQTMRMLTKYCGPAAPSRDLQVLVVSGINSPPHPVPLFSQRQCSAFLIVIVYHSNPIESVWLPQPRSLVRQAKILIIFVVDFIIF